MRRYLSAVGNGSLCVDRRREQTTSPAATTFVCHVLMCSFGKLPADTNGKFTTAYASECVCELGVECTTAVIDYEDAVCVAEVVGGEARTMCVDY